MADLSVCMIARDEEDCIGPALESVRDVAAEIIVVDTGSLDRTCEIAAGMGAKVIKRRWMGDFSAARNAALDNAACGWILVLDADERLRPESKWHVKRAMQTNAEGCLVKVVNYLGDGGEKEVSAALRMFRNRPDYRFTGIIHETIGPAIEKLAPDSVLATEIVLDHLGYMDSFVERKAKKTRNYEMAREAVRRQPDDAFCHFNLGVELFRLGRLVEVESCFAEAGLKLSGSPSWGCKLFKTWATILLRLRKPDKALSVAEQGLDLYPGFTDLYYTAGLAHLDLEDYQQAESLFLHCLQMGNAPVPPFAAADMGIATYKSRFALGRVYLCEGRYVDAADEFRKAYEANDRLVSALALMGGAHRAAGREEDFAAYLSSLAKGPLFQAEVLCASWMFERALAVLEEAGPSPKARCIRALGLSGAGRLKEAALLLGELQDSGMYQKEIRAAYLFCRMCLGRASLDEAGDWPEEEKRLVTQHSYTRDILELEKAVRERPAQRRISKELQRLRREVRRKGYRDV